MFSTLTVIFFARSGLGIIIIHDIMQGYINDVIVLCTRRHHVLANNLSEQAIAQREMVPVRVVLIDWLDLLD